MKVLLIQPSISSSIKRVFIPVGLAYLGSTLEEAGHKVKILYTFNSKKGIIDFKNELDKYDPDVVGISSTTIDIHVCLQLVNITKEQNPNCLTVLGGAHPTVCGKEILNQNHNVDVIVRGEGEVTLKELLEKKNKKDFVSVKGISFRFNKKIIENPERKNIEDLDSLPFPAYHLLPMKEYINWRKLFNVIEFGKTGSSYASITSSRGCPFNCTFCSSRRMWGNKWRIRSPENVIEELKILRYKYKKKYIYFIDDTATIDKKRMSKICQLIRKEDIDISWECSTRVDLFDKNLAKELKKSGCVNIYLGLESGVQETLDFVCKGIKVEDSIRAVKIAKDAGLTIESNFIIGVPGETKEKINKTISFVKKIDIEYPSFTILTPYPGTKIYEYAEKNNLLLTKDWSKYNLTGSVMKVPGITEKELKALYIKANLICNFSPSNIFKSLSRELSLKQIDKKTI